METKLRWIRTTGDIAKDLSDGWNIKQIAVDTPGNGLWIVLEREKPNKGNENDSNTD